MTVRIPAFLILMTTAWTLAAQPAERIFTNGNVWTVDPAMPRAQAVAVRGGIIIAVGTDSAVARYRGGTTEVIDLQGRLMLPGFIDNHTHFIAGGFQLSYVDLRATRSEKEFADSIAAYARLHPGQWIQGGDWDHDNWPGGSLPTRQTIDAAAGTCPVFVSRYDGHMGLANTEALRRAGITRSTQDPAGGTIVRDPATGEPTGILKDAAMDLVYVKIPDPTMNETLEAARLAIHEAIRYGVTEVQDISSMDHLKAYTLLQERNKLPIRIYARLPLSSIDGTVPAGGVPFTMGMITLGSYKAFADGSLGSSTALFFAPYDSDPSTRGLPMESLTSGELERDAMTADRSRCQLSIHAIGDSANSLVLDLFERIVKANPAWDRRFRIEHAQHIAPKDFKRFSDLRVIASVQPYHAIDDGRWAEQRIGRERCRTTYPFKTFLENGVKLCFGSDWTVAPINPLLGIYAAVTRRTTDGKNPGGWFPEQSIGVEQAIECYTINNAYAAFEEGTKGSITSGKAADFTVLDRNILACDPEDIRTAKVVMTIVAGRTVYVNLPVLH